MAVPPQMSPDGKPDASGLRDRFVGETTKYVVTKAPCRIVLTAPPSRHGPTVAREPEPSR